MGKDCAILSRSLAAEKGPLGWSWLGIPGAHWRVGVRNGALQAGLQGPELLEVGRLGSSPDLADGWVGKEGEGGGRKGKEGEGTVVGVMQIEEQDTGSRGRHPDTGKLRVTKGPSSSGTEDGLSKWAETTVYPQGKKENSRPPPDALHMDYVKRDHRPRVRAGRHAKAGLGGMGTRKKADREGSSLQQSYPGAYKGELRNQKGLGWRGI